MKAFKCVAALPLILAATTLVAFANVGADVPLPEQIFPQLDGILKKAVQQSPRMISQALELEMAENNRISARSGLLPNVSAYYSYNRARDKQSLLYDNNPAGNSVNSYSPTKTPYAVTLSQPVFNWGERRNGAKIGEIQKSFAEGQYREAYRQLAQTLRGSYLQLIVLKMNAKKMHAYQQYTADQLKQDEERLQKKVISEAEIFGARLTAERAQIGLERADYDLENARVSFARLAGLGSAFSDADIPDNIPNPDYHPETLKGLLAGFLSQKDPINPEAVALTQQKQVEDLNYKIARTRLWPKVSAAMGLTQDQQNNLYGTGLNFATTSQYAGLTVSWSIFDGFATKAAVRNSLARRRQLEISYQQLTERLAQDAQQQVKLVDFSARNMSISNRLMESGEGVLKLREEENRRGIRSEAEVTQSRLSYYDAQISAFAARREYLMGVGDFLGMVVQDPVVANITDK